MARHNKPKRSQQPKKSTALVVQHSTPVPFSTRVGERTADSLRLQATTGLLHELHLVWMQLRADWNWIVVIPADPGFSTATLGKGLSEVGARISARPVDFIEANDVDLDNASWLLDRLGSAAGGAAFSRDAQSGPGGWVRQTPRTVVALESPLLNPLALPIALAADGVVLCVRGGASSMNDVRQTVDTVGQERIICSVMLE